jgi:phosphatidylglycerol:prolipoprotein diacylglycerol transferase
VLAFLLASSEARKSGQNDEDYLDYLLYMVIPVILGARIYYILFSLDDYVSPGKGFWNTLKDMLNIRNGGLAIYGGILAGILVAVLFARKRKLSLPLMGDTICMGVLVGQILGRWGNFFNREVFGACTDSVFRMAIPVDYFTQSGSFNHMVDSGIITMDMLNNTELVNGVQCITVHPTFLYEGLWNLALFLIIFLYRKHKRFDGELAMLYVLGYGIGRYIVEGVRADTLMIGSFKISQLVSLVGIAAALAVLLYNYISIARGKTPKCHRVVGKASTQKKAAE